MVDLLESFALKPRTNKLILEQKKHLVWCFSRPFRLCSFPLIPFLLIYSWNEALSGTSCYPLQPHVWELMDLPQNLQCTENGNIYFFLSSTNIWSSLLRRLKHFFSIIKVNCCPAAAPLVYVFITVSPWIIKQCGLEIYGQGQIS